MVGAPWYTALLPLMLVPLRRKSCSDGKLVLLLVLLVKSGRIFGFC